MNSIRKIYINSKYRNPNSICSTDFNITLPTNVLIENSRVVIDNVSFNNTFNSIGEYNNKLYVQIYTDNFETSEFFIVNLTQVLNIDGPILATIIKNSLNNATDSTLQQNQFDTVYDINNNELTIKMLFNNTFFKIWTDFELINNKLLWFGDAYDQNNLQSYNSNLSHSGLSSFHQIDYDFVSEYLIFDSIENVYLICDSFGSADSILHDRIDNILLKIPINSNKNEKNIYNPTNSFSDSIIIKNPSNFRNLKFRLTDSNFNTVLLNNNNIQFTILFYQI